MRHPIETSFPNTISLLSPMQYLLCDQAISAAIKEDYSAECNRDFSDWLMTTSLLPVAVELYSTILWEWIRCE